MMSREAHIPLALWICAAILAHMAGGGGAVEIAKVYEERADVRAFIRGVRQGLRPPDTTFEVLTDDTPVTPPTQASEPPDKASEPSDEAPDPDAAEAKLLEPDKPRREAEEPKKEEPKPEQPKPEEKKAEIVPEEPKPVVPMAPPPKDNRIAIRQHVEKGQKDNPNASRIADDAHHTEEETVARIRSKDQDSPDPTPGSKAGPRGEIGDSDEERPGHSEDKDGDPSHAPGEGKEASTSPEHHDPSPPAPPRAPAAPEKAPSPAKAAVAPRAPAPVPAAPPPAPGGAGPAAPEVHAQERGGYTLDPANPGGDGRSKSAGRKQPTPPFHNPVDVRSMGLNAAAEPGRINPNVTLPQVAAAVGDDKLKAERAADGAARRAKHRGSWETNKFERWRAAIENYEPSVKLGNQTSLNAARVPFATYINSIHNRLHPIFAEEFLASLDNLPAGHAMSDMQLVTHIEIVLSKDEGRIVRMGVTRPSGVTAFDIVALNSVQRASPYGKAPDAIVSPDGNVYLHWEFHRDPFDACTTRNARPFLLKSPPQLQAPPALVPRRPPSTRPSDERMGPSGPLIPLR